MYSYYIWKSDKVYGFDELTKKRYRIRARF